jgi:multiple antibiotic resistance protein
LVEDALLIYDFLTFFQAFITLFAIFDPIGILPMFSALTSNMNQESRNKVIRTSCLVSLGILLTFAYGGAYLFQLLNITLTDFQVFAGLVLLIFAITYVLGREPQRFLPEREEDIAVFPLATPLLAGPGSISLVLLLVSPPYGPITALLVIILNIAIAWIVLRLGLRINSLLGRQGSAVISRIMGLIIGAVAFSLLRSGFTDIVRQIAIS